MANFTRVRAPATWTLASVLEPAEVEQFDADHVKTINATDGSTHAPSSAIIIGGSGLNVTGQLTASGTNTISGATTLTNVVAEPISDAVLWELLRLKTGSATPDRAILPYGKRDAVKESGLTSTATVQGNTADGSVRVMPFRAIIGSTDTSDQLKKLRDQHSAVLVGASTQQTTLLIAANAAGNPRWTLVYAAVTPGAPTTVTVTTTNGTAAASPTRPSLPADGSGIYYIGLAYIWVPNGFGAASTVERGAIHEVEPCYPMPPSLGVVSMLPPSSLYATGGAVDVNQAGTALRGGAYLPPTMVGGRTLLIPIQRGDTPFSHQDGDVVDNSIDWRFRLFRWSLHQGTGGAAAEDFFAFDRNQTGGRAPAATTATTSFLSTGQSFRDDSVAAGLVVADCQGVAVYRNFGGGEALSLYVRNTDGALVFKHTILTRTVFVWLEASAPYSNFAKLNASTGATEP